MNPEHRQLCASAGWAEHLRAEVLPWALADTPAHCAALLEVGPGPGAATEMLRQGADQLTALEYDAALADGLRDRFADDPVVVVVRGDAAAMPFGTATFDGVRSFTMLHHLPDAAAQDRALAEFARVLRPGGLLCGTDSLDSPGLRRLHSGDRLVPLDPLTLGARLRAAGLVGAWVSVLAFGVRFRAWAPD